MLALKNEQSKQSKKFLNPFDNKKDENDGDKFKNEDKVGDNNEIKLKYESIDLTKPIIFINGLKLNIKELPVVNDNRWVIIANQLLNNQVNIEDYIFNIKLKTPLNGYKLYIKNMKEERDKILEGKGLKKNLKNVNKINSDLWKKLPEKVKRKYYVEYLENKKIFEYELILVNMVLFLFYDHINNKISDKDIIFAKTITMSLMLSNEFIPTALYIKEFREIYNNNPYDKNFAYLKMISEHNYKVLSKFFSDSEFKKEEFVSEIINIDKEKIFTNITPEDAFKNDLLKFNDKNLINNYGLFYRELPKDIQKLYEIKAQKSNIMNKYKQIKVNQINKI